MRAAALLFLLLTSFGAVHAQTSQQDWQAQAVRKYPELGVAGSEFNKRFVAAHEQLRKTNPEFFKDARWPMLLADRVAVPVPSSGITTPVPEVAAPRPPTSNAHSTSAPTRDADQRPQTIAVPPSKSQAVSRAEPLVTIDPATLFFAALIAGAIFWYVISVVSQHRKRRRMMEKYGDKRLVDMIMRRMFWTNQTEEQLIDSLGRPVDVDQKVLKTKTKEVWKYHPTGRNRYALRITVENGVVVGWDQK